MDKVRLGRTGITVNKNGFGALPIQRAGKEEAARILRKAYDNGIRLFDTARAYSDSEEKIHYALSDVREDIFITTKTMAETAGSLAGETGNGLHRRIPVSQSAVLPETRRRRRII